jgi:outer membrane immunogenic protein
MRQTAKGESGIKVAGPLNDGPLIMKKILLSTVALFGLATGAMAADLPRRTVAPVFAPVPVFTWTGFYVGVNVGYAFAGDDDDDFDFFDDDTTRSIRFFPGDIRNSEGTDGTLTFNNDDDVFGRRGSGDGDGFVGGAQVGFNYQLTPGSGLVIGVEADIQFADLGGDDDRFGDRSFAAGTYVFTGTPGLAFAPPPATVVVNNDGIAGGIDWFGTVRGRLGFAVDRVLFYGTGGLAFAEGGRGSRGFCDRFGDCDDGDDWRWGYAVGGGIEYAFTNNLTVKIEGLYVNLEDDDDDRGRGDRSFFDVPTNTLFVRNSAISGGDDFFVIRGGLNFKFGG